MAEPEAGDRGAGPGRASRWSAAVGSVAGVVALGFVARLLWSEGPSVRRAVDGAHLGWLFVAIALAAAAMVAMAAGWRWVLRAVGVEVPAAQAVRWYFVGELGKYLPGGVWSVVGRGELARRGGVPRTAAYVSVGLSLAALYLAAALVAAAALPFALGSGTALSPWMLVLVVLPLGVVALHPSVAGAVLTAARRVTGRELLVAPPSWGRSVALVVRYSVCWLLVGTSTWAVARALVEDVSLPRLVFASVLSWLAGFLAVPVPAGAGVREAVLVAASGLAAGPAAVVALVSRLLFVLVDATGALLSATRRGRRGGPG